MKTLDIILEQIQEDIQSKIISFFKENPKPSDKEVHSFVNKLNEHKFEEIIYSIMGSFFGAGRSKDFKGTYDPKELKMGIDVEKEHTTNPLIAERISKDHLSEFPDYYTRLKKMEAEGEK